MIRTKVRAAKRQLARAPAPVILQASIHRTIPPAQSHETPKFLVFGAPSIEEAEIAEVIASMKSGWLGTGPKVAQFGKRFCPISSKRRQTRIALNSCTAALHLSLLASNLGPGDEVITTPLTFCATINAIIHAGHAKPACFCGSSIRGR